MGKLIITSSPGVKDVSNYFGMSCVIKTIITDAHGSAYKADYTMQPGWDRQTLTEAVAEAFSNCDAPPIAVHYVGVTVLN